MLRAKCMSAAAKRATGRTTRLTPACQAFVSVKGKQRSAWHSECAHLNKTCSSVRWASTAAALREPPDDVGLPERADVPTSRVDEKKVVIGWDTHTYSRYHHLWLRDHCRCSQCFHSVTKQRLLNTFELPNNVKPIAVESKAEGLEVHWPSSQPHTSFFPWSWLRYNSYDPPLVYQQQFEKILWGSRIQQAPPTVTYEEAMAEDDNGVYKWLTNVDKFGFCFVSGVPPTPEATEELSQRIGFIRETQYGRFWDFTSDLAKGDTAYTTLALGAHTDTTYFTDPCGLQLFHLLEHSNGTGGATLLVDGFYVASILQELHPEAYRVLTTVPVPTHAAGEPSAIYTPSLGPSPVLREENGLLAQVRWNNDDRSVMRIEPTLLEEWYDAVRIWNKFLKSPDSEYWVQLHPGTAVVVDNHRVLHGRSAFTGKRRMCGAYIGVDEYRSRLAVLRERFAPDAVVQETSAYASANGRTLWHPAL